jgi:DMSO/TMAO reductase YedYZ molybdopterin-dependent catalytic subunit
VFMTHMNNEWIFVLPAAALGLALFLACVEDRPRQKTQSVEIKEYQGQKLDPLSKFEENSIKGPQHVDIDRYALKIGGLVDKPLSYSYEQVLSHQSVSKITVIHCVEGWEVKILWEGVPLPDLLDAAGVKSAANTVIFRSADGYSTSLPLATVIKKNIILAFKMNGLTLPQERGFPFQVVAEDKWGYKWAKWVTDIELSDNPEYRGYWESRGYNNNGDHSGPMFERKK